MSEFVQREVSCDVLTLTMNRAEKRNALTGEMYDALRQAIEASANDGVRAIVLTGSGGSFSAGNDLAGFLTPRTGPFEQSPAALFMKALVRNTVPIIAAVDGVAVGIGTTLLLHCDLVFATPRSKFRLPFADLGIVPEAGSSVILPQRLGLQIASELLMTGRFFDSHEAHRWGLVNAIVEDDALPDRSRAAALALAEKPATALALTRSMIRGDTENLLAVIDAEFEAFGQALASSETQSRIAAAGKPRA